MSLIIQLGETRGEIYRNGVLSIDIDLWDKMVEGFNKLWEEDDEDEEMGN